MIQKLSSKEVKEKLKIRSCELMHLREKGVLSADKKGNAYLYSLKDVEAYKDSIQSNKVDK